MGKTHYRNNTRQYEMEGGNDISIEIPRQYQAATLTIRVSGSFVCGTDAVAIHNGGFHNLLKRVQFVVGGNNQLFSSPGVMVAHWAAARRRQNVDDLVYLYAHDGAIVANAAEANGSVRSIPGNSEQVDFHVDFPIDFEHVSGLRPDDTLFNLNRPRETVYMRLTPADDLLAAITATAGVTGFNAKVEVIVDQFQSIMDPSVRPSIPIAAEFTRGEQTLQLTSATTQAEARFSTSPFYSGFMIGLFDTATLRPAWSGSAGITQVRGITSVVNRVEALLAQQQYQVFYPEADRFEAARLFGDYVLSTDYPAFLPILFTRRPGTSPDELTDSWLTIDSNDVKLRIDHNASDGNELRILYEQMRPLDPDDFIGKMIGIPAAQLSAARQGVAAAA